jgi:hypothetical protein
MHSKNFSMAKRPEKTKVQMFWHSQNEIRFPKIILANPVPVMKTGTPCVIGKTCFNHSEKLLSLQGSCSHCKEPVFKTGGFLHASCFTLFKIALIDGIFKKF